MSEDLLELEPPEKRYNQSIVVPIEAGASHLHCGLFLAHSRPISAKSFERPAQTRSASRAQSAAVARSGAPSSRYTPLVSPPNQLDAAHRRLSVPSNRIKRESLTSNRILFLSNLENKK